MMIQNISHPKRHLFTCTSPHTDRETKGHLDVGGTHIKVNSYHSAVNALALLKEHASVPGYDEIGCRLKYWMEFFGPSTSNAIEEEPIKKKPDDKGRNDETRLSKED